MVVRVGDDKILDELTIPLIKRDDLSKSEYVDKFYISDIAFTMGWLNTFHPEDFEKLAKQVKIEVKKIHTVPTLDRGEVGVYACCDGIVIVSSSGLFDEENFILFYKIPEEVKLKILTSIARSHFEKFLPEVRHLLAYKNMLKKKKEEGKLVVINPAVLSASEKATLEGVTHTVELIEKFLKGEIKIESIEDLRGLIKKVRKFSGF